MRRHKLTLIAIALILLTQAAFIVDCSKKQPRTVADALHSLGEIKRKARAAGEITPQQSADMTRKLDAMNRSYRQFVADEQKRIAEGKPDPSARTQALSQLRSMLNGITDPGVLGFKSEEAREGWSAAIGTLNTILAGFGG